MDELSGTVERVTFHTEDTGYSVLKVRVRGRHEPVTVTGRVPLINEGFPQWIPNEARIGNKQRILREFVGLEHFNRII